MRSFGKAGSSGPVLMQCLARSFQQLLQRLGQGTYLGIRRRVSTAVKDRGSSRELFQGLKGEFWQLGSRLRRGAYPEGSWRLWQLGGQTSQWWCCLSCTKAAENSLTGNMALSTVSGFFKDELFPPVRKQLSIKPENVFIQKYHCKMKAQVNLQEQPASMARVFLWTLIVCTFE